MTDNRIAIQTFHLKIPQKDLFYPSYFLTFLKNIVI